MPGGSRVSNVSVFGSCPRTSRRSPTLRFGSSTSIACGRLPSVAESPHVISCGFHCRRRASASCACTPRLLPISSCHSSTTTIARCAKRSWASARESSSDRLSGVVTSVVGKRRVCCARFVAVVSPLRTPTVQRKSRSSSGALSARSVSAARARIGVSHRTVNGGAGFVLRDFFEADGAALASAGETPNRFSAPSHTAYVLPAPVVA